MKNSLYLKLVLAGVFASGTLVGCQDYELEKTEETSIRRGYEEGFVQTFGQVNPNQCWDLSSFAPKQANTRAAATDGYETIASDDGWYYVDSNTLDWFLENWKEGEKHDDIIPTTFKASNRDLTYEITPTYQGAVGMAYDLHIVEVNPDGREVRDINVMHRSDNIQKKTWDGGNWNNLEPNWSTRDAYAVRAKPYTFTISANNFFYFYLDINESYTSGYDQYLGWNPRSIEDFPQMGAVRVPEDAFPANINPDYEATILGWEDLPLESSDQDYNDWVFLLTGYSTKPIYKEQPFNEVIAKRYMIEDLGSTFDYDFNDIVVTVRQRTTGTYRIDTETGVATPIEGTVSSRQWCQVNRLCGTMPIQIKVGDTWFGQVTNPTNAEAALTQLFREDTGTLGDGDVWDHKTTIGITPDQGKFVTGWDPDANNVKVYVWKIENPTADYTSVDGVWTNEFPGIGEIPYMIAVDDGVMWMDEGVHIPAEWMEKGDMSTGKSVHQ